MRRTLCCLAVVVAVLGSGVAAAGSVVEPPPPRPARAVAATVRIATPPVGGDVVQPFRPPASRFGAGHRGVDLQAAGGDPVTTALGGRVTFSGEVAGVGWVTVSHGGGLDTTYGPVRPRLVAAGETVDAGDLLGLLAEGATWLNWGARHNDEYVDPLSLLGPWEVHLTRAGVPPPPFGVLLAAAGAPASPGRLLTPVTGVPTSGFGPRTHPITGDVRHHDGLDFGAPAGTPVRSAGAGRVAFAGTAGGYGLLVMVDHGGGLTTRYAHLSRIDVRTGDAVESGSAIGAVGSTGASTGPHLHFEVRVGGASVDPSPWLG